MNKDLDSVEDAAAQLLGAIQAVTNDASWHVAACRDDADHARQILVQLANDAALLVKAQREVSQRLELAVSEAGKVQGRQLAAALAHDAADLFGERVCAMQEEANRLLAVYVKVRTERGVAHHRKVWTWGTLTVCLSAILIWGWVNKSRAEAERPNAVAEFGRVSAAQLSSYGANVVVGPDGVYLVTPRGFDQARCGTAGGMPCLRLR
ncbi:MAG: hypothetical protein V4695_10710 [Pseudomonadota bacterium]